MDLIDFSHNRIVLSANIEYSFYTSEITMEKNKNIPEVVIAFVRDVILRELPKKLTERDISFQTKILEIRKGSIDVDFLIQNLVLLTPLAKNAYDEISRFKAFSDSIELICNKSESLLCNTLERIGISSTVKVKPNVINYVDGKAPMNCECERLCDELTHCAGTLETSLIKNGAILGQDFTKLDCFKLAIELMKNCHQLNNLS